MTCAYDKAVKTTELFRISAALLLVNGLYMKADTKPNTDAAAFSDCSALQCWLKCCFTSTETVGLLGTGAQDGHLDFHTTPEL